MVELVYNGEVYGVYSTEEIARIVASTKEWGVYNIVPLGTFLRTDETEGLIEI